MGTAARSSAAVPEPVGTNRNWLQAVGGYYHLAGLRRDGTLWQWGQSGGGVGKPAGSGIEPTQVDSNRDWVGIAATANHSVALRRDGTLWAW
jgi:alpha-tubulin suppressor-like RCC1 family protein